MWEELLNAQQRGKDIEFVKKAEAKPKVKLNPFAELNKSTKTASAILAGFDKLAKEKAADDWFKEALIDSSQMQGGAPPMPPGGMPMDPSMMGGMPPVDPAAMGMMPPGGAPPMPMDPSMMGAAPPMDPAMMGGMPPAPMPADPALMGVDGKKKRPEEVIVQQCAAIKELLYSLFNQLGLEPPLSVVDDTALARVLLEKKETKEKEQMIDSNRINPITPLTDSSQKIGGILESFKDSQNKLAAIQRTIN